MLNTFEEIRKMIPVLKENGFSIHTIEKELGFYNGLIGKVLNGTMDLSDEKFEKLRSFYDQKIVSEKGTLSATDLNLIEYAKNGLSENEFSKEEIDSMKMAIATPVRPLTKEEKKQTVVTPKGELKQTPSKEAMKRVSDTMDKINKRFGAGTIMTFGDKPQEGYQVVSTGSKRLDDAIGIGGLPRGRMVEIVGYESCGKTTIALHVIANAQQQGLKCLYIDAENAFSPEYADAIGVEISELRFCQPSAGGEEALEVADMMITAGEVQVVVFDSVAALIPKAEIEGEHGESKMGLHARLMSQACRKLVGIIAKQNVLVIFINQFRNKIGMVFGDPSVPTGGLALQFYASVRLEVRRSVSEKNSVMNGDVKEGNKTTVKVVKNKCGNPFRSATFDIIYGRGIVEN